MAKDQGFRASLIVISMTNSLFEQAEGSLGRIVFQWIPVFIWIAYFSHYLAPGVAKLAFAVTLGLAISAIIRYCRWFALGFKLQKEQFEPSRRLLGFIGFLITFTGVILTAPVAAKYSPAEWLVCFLVIYLFRFKARDLDLI